METQKDLMRHITPGMNVFVWKYSLNRKIASSANLQEAYLEQIVDKAAVQAVKCSSIIFKI